jgi:hypothetical protein
MRAAARARGPVQRVRCPAAVCKMMVAAWCSFPSRPAVQAGALFSSRPASIVTAPYLERVVVDRDALAVSHVFHAVARQGLIGIRDISADGAKTSRQLARAAMKPWPKCTALSTDCLGDVLRR